MYCVEIFFMIVLFNRQLSIALAHVASKLGLMKTTIEGGFLLVTGTDYRL